MSELKKLAEQVEGRGFKPIIVFDSTDGELTSVCWKQADRAYAACANDDGTLSVIGLTAEQAAMATLGAEGCPMALLQRIWDAFHYATAREFVTVKNELRMLGIEVE